MLFPQRFTALQKFVNAPAAAGAANDAAVVTSRQ
jgi:hypothetical protein